MVLVTKIEQIFAVSLCCKFYYHVVAACSLLWRTWWQLIVSLLRRSASVQVIWHMRKESF